MYVEEYNDEVGYNDDQNIENDYQQEEPKNSFWDNNKGLIFKIIIIILCIVILVWLIFKIKNNNQTNTQDSSIVYAGNVDTMRLAAEKYFFIDGNLPKNNETLTISLNELSNKGYVSEIVDENKNVCNGNSSYATLTKGANSYVLTINLVCLTNNKPQIYNYGLENNVCLDCTGFTYMDGSTNNNTDNNDDNNSDNDNSDNNTSDDNDDELEFTCSVWSDWTDKKINDSSLEVRTRVLVLGAKKGGTKEKITYGEWSDYTKNTITPTDTLEVETKIKSEEVWVDKTSNTPVTESATIKNVKKTTTGGNSYTYCPSGYKKESNKCVKYSEIKTGDLTYAQYNTYKVLNKPCDGPYVVDGKTIIKNCQYQVKETTNLKYGTSNSSTVYTYQELVKQDVTYYRSRSKKVETVYEDSIILDKYMEEKDLPEGYVKVKGSEKIQYSYKLKECEK